MTEEKTARRGRLKLDKVTIKRDGDGWIVTRERAENGESYRGATLEDCFNYVRVLYDKNGEYKEQVYEPYISNCGVDSDRGASVVGEYLHTDGSQNKEHP